jgi:hypothetical protein
MLCFALRIHWPGRRERQRPNGIFHLLAELLEFRVEWRRTHDERPELRSKQPM